MKLITLVGLFSVACMVATSHAAIVFADDFSEPSGTAIIGKSPDIGSLWTSTNGSDPLVSASNTLNTAGAARALFSSFTGTVGVGDRLTLSFDTQSFSDNFNGYSGVSLYDSIGERIFVGNTDATGWGMDGNVTGNVPSNPVNNTAITSVTFTYLYNSGAWTLNTTGGVNLSGIGTPGVALNRLRVANGDGGDIQLDNLRVDVSAVPEPSSIALLGLGGLALLRRRR